MTASPSDRSSSSIWAITAYFNPHGYRRRLRNYRIFQRRLSVPLVTVELAYSPRFELATDDADVLIQLRGRDVLWQKERLLNIALGALPDCCQHVAWLDSDIIFDRDNWPKLAIQGLEQFPMIQLFTTAYDFTRDAPPNPFGSHHVQHAVDSLVHRVRLGGAASNLLFPEDQTRRPGGWAFGLAWAIRRDAIQPHGFYDACVVGAGDVAINSSAFGELNGVISWMHMNRRRAEHYLEWARPFCDTIRGRVGCIGGGVYHLWHGNLMSRGQKYRHLRFKEFEFDPYEDVTLDDQHVWRWNSDKPAMHRYLRAYFAMRKEDGQ